MEKARRGPRQEGGPRTEAEKKRILKARAKALAAEPEKAEPGEQIEIVQFFLSFEKYGVESRYVREVWPLKEYASVPCTPPFVLGIINVRGEILSVIDIRRFFDSPQRDSATLTGSSSFLREDMEFGILADAIAGVRTVLLETCCRLRPRSPGSGVSISRVSPLTGAPSWTPGRFCRTKDRCE